MTYDLFTRIALNVDVPAHNLRKGDVATIVEYHEGIAGQEPGYSLEVFSRRFVPLGDGFAKCCRRDGGGGHGSRITD